MGEGCEEPLTDVVENESTVRAEGAVLLDEGVESVLRRALLHSAHRRYPSLSAPFGRCSN